MSRKNIYADGAPGPAIPAGQTVAVTAENSDKQKGKSTASAGCCK